MLTRFIYNFIFTISFSSPETNKRSNNALFIEKKAFVIEKYKIKEALTNIEISTKGEQKIILVII